MKRTLRSWAAGASRREVTKRAAGDLARGLKNTDCRARDKSSDTQCARPRGARRPKPR